MSTPLLSVILPVYNAEKFLLDALESISAQTFQNWEMLAINDGSTDNSLEILKKYAVTEPRIRLINRENKGLAATLNEGIIEAKGEWIARMDADDISLPHRFESQLAWIQKQQADVCGGGIKWFGDQSGNSWAFPTTCEGIYAWLLFKPAFSHPTVVMKKEVAKRFLYNTHFKHAQDYELWTRMALNSVRMTNLPEIVLRYRIHGTQISQAKKELQTNLRMKITREYWQNSPLSHDLAFHTCLMDEREIIDHEKFRSVIRSLKTVEARLTDDQAIAAINHHRIWFIYRSINLGHQAILPAVKNLRLSKLKRIAIAMLSFFRAGCLISYFRHAQWLRHLPLKWLF